MFYAVVVVFTAADRDTVRTNYKRLAMKWLPENNNHSPESIKVITFSIFDWLKFVLIARIESFTNYFFHIFQNFLEISMAYKRLQIKTDIVQMSVVSSHT